jgi:hypothetical protein
MNAKYSKTELACTIFRKRDGVYVFVCNEGSVARINRLHVVKSSPLENSLAEFARDGVVLVVTITGVAAITEATPTDLASITEVAAITDVVAIADVVTITGVAAIAAVATIANFATVANVATITEVIEDLPGLRNDIANYDRSMKRVLEAALER